MKSSHSDIFFIHYSSKHQIPEKSQTENSDVQTEKRCSNLDVLIISTTLFIWFIEKYSSNCKEYKWKLNKKMFYELEK